MGKHWKQWQTLFLGGSKIIADGDCSHEIRRRLLLGRKVMSNLDSMLKSRDITLPTKVHIFKAIVFLVVMYRSESWTIRKTECLKNWCFQIVVLEQTLESPLDSKIKPVSTKGNQPWIFIGRTDAEAEASILWPSDAKSQLVGKDPDAGKDWRQRTRGWQRVRWLDMDINLSKLRERVQDRGAWLAVAHGLAKSQTGLSEWTTAS